MTHVATVTIDSTKVDADLTNYPIYIDLSDMPAAFWSTVANGGGDIRVFKSDGTTELAREVVTCDTTGETGELHVLFSGVLSSSSDTDIQIHADGSSSDYTVGATYGRNAVWADYEAVYHGDDLTDSSGNADLSIDVGSPVVDTASSWGRGIDLTSSNALLRGIPSSFPSLSSASTLQVSGTDAASPGTADDGLIGIADSGTYGRNWAFGFYGSGTRAPRQTRNDARVSGSAFGTGAVSGAHYWKSVTYDGTAATSYDTYDGNVNSHPFSGAQPAESWDCFALGGLGDLSPNRYMGGVVAEARIRADELSSSWISTEYNNQSSTSTFYTAAAAASGTDISPSDSASATVSDPVPVTQTHEVAPAGSASATVSDPVTVTETETLSIASSVSETVSDPVPVTQTHEIAPAGSASATVSDPAPVTQTHEIAPVGSASATISDSVTVTGANSLAPASSVSETVSDPVPITQTHELAPVGSASATVSDPVPVTQTHEVAPAGSVSATVSDSVTVSEVDTLAIDSSASATVSDSVPVTQTHEVAPAGSASATVSDSVDVTGPELILINSSASATVSDPVPVTQTHELAPSGSASATVSDPVPVTQTHELAPSGSASATVSDSVVVYLKALGTIDDPGIALATRQRDLDTSTPVRGIAA